MQHGAAGDAANQWAHHDDRSAAHRAHLRGWGGAGELARDLEDVARQAASKGAVFVTQGAGGASWIASPRMERDVADYFAAGWTLRDIAGALIADRHPGFRAEADYLPVEQIHRLPVHAEFFDPRGYVAGAGTIIQGAQDDMLMCILEGFGTHAAAQAAIPWLDTLRPHLGRAFSLTARLAEAQASATVAAFGHAAMAAALVSGDGRLRAVNDRFSTRLGERMSERAGGLRFADRILQDRFAQALAAMAIGAAAQSVAVPATADEPAVVLHLMPLQRGARDVFGWDGVLILLAEPANATVPGADLLRLLFDLTPAEARLTRHLLEGRTPTEAATLMRVADATARTHLRHIFAKTGVRRQAELVRLLLGMGGPGDRSSLNGTSGQPAIHHIVQTDDARGEAHR